MQGELRDFKGVMQKELHHFRGDMRKEFRDLKAGIPQETCAPNADMQEVFPDFRETMQNGFHSIKMDCRDIKRSLNILLLQLAAIFTGLSAVSSLFH